MTEKQQVTRTESTTTSSSGGGTNVPVTSAAEQEVADAGKVDQALNGPDAGEHAADGSPTQADKA